MQDNFLAAIGAYKENDIAQAISLYEQCLQDNPDHIESIYNLGNIYMQQQQWTTAIQYYEQALKLVSGEYAIHYNLALAYLNSEQFGKSVWQLQQVVAIKPEHFNANHLLACIYHKNNKIAQAQVCFIQALSIVPDDVDARFNFGVFYLENEQLEDASKQFLLCLKYDPCHVGAMQNLIVISKIQNDIPGAINYLEKLINISEDSLTAITDLAYLLHNANKAEQALHWLVKGLIIAPDDELLLTLQQYLNSSVNAVNLSDAYIKKLYANYARFYEEHMQATLNYKLPELIFKTVNNINLISRQKKIDVLDLGCGSGLMGKLFASYANNLVGVDLSKEMLIKAKSKNIYTKIYEEEIIKYCLNSKDSFDLIIAVEVFPYFNSLDAIFANVYRLLNDKGCFIFSVEHSESSAIKQNKSLRFAHSVEYIEGLIDQYNYKQLLVSKQAIRMQNQEVLIGNVFYLKKFKYYKP